jgi:hypothetical protein
MKMISGKNKPPINPYFVYLDGRRVGYRDWTGQLVTVYRAGSLKEAQAIAIKLNIDDFES